MRIGIIGAGSMAKALGSGWARAGHDVFVGARSPARAAEAARVIGYGASSGSEREAAARGEVVLLAVPAAASQEVLQRVGDALGGKTVIDCMNAFEPDSTDGGIQLAQPAVAELVAEMVPTAGVVKAFNICSAEVWGGDARVFEGLRLSVPLCGDDPDALERVEVLVRDLYLEPVRAGGLSRARYLEATAALVAGLWFRGGEPRSMLPPLTAAFGA